MNRLAPCLGALVASAILFTSVAFAQQRSLGVSMHMLPKRVAEIGGMQWGFSVDYSPRLKPESKAPVLQTVSEVLSYFHNQDASVKRNGIWIVTTNPEAYSQAEMNLLEKLKLMCRNEKIPLFICRASQLPNGWLRADR